MPEPKVIKHPPVTFLPRHGESGQAILESILCFFGLTVLLLMLLGIFHMAAAKIITEYSSYNTARAHGLGYNDVIVTRAARLAAAGASGSDVSAYPLPKYPSFYDVNDRSHDYLVHGNGGYNEYGVDFLYWQTRDDSKTYFNVSHSENGKKVEAESWFVNYPFLDTVSNKNSLTFNTKQHFEKKSPEIELINFSSYILEE